MTAPKLCCIKTCNDPAEDKPNTDGDYLCPDHMQDWHDERVLFPRAKPADHLGRSDKDFAIEFGEYLARAAEAILPQLDDPAALRSAIYEFRKRAIRANIPTADHLYGESKPEIAVTRVMRNARAL